MKRLHLWCAALLIMLLGCSQELGPQPSSSTAANPPAEEAGYTVQLYGAKVIPIPDAVPRCGSSTVGVLYYILDNQSFQYCTLNGFVTLDHGMNGLGCTATDNRNGSLTLACSDGSSATLYDGDDCAVSTQDNGSYLLVCGTTEVTVSNGKDGSSCTVTNKGDGVQTIACADGTTATVLNGADGINGTDGASCSVLDNGDGTKTLRCTDGQEVTLRDGVDGAAGQPGADGTDGVSCTVADNGQGVLTQTCGTTEVSWPKALCGTVAYEPADYACVNEALQGRCGEALFDLATHFCDARDQRLYEYVVIGTQTWMAENVNIGQQVLGMPYGANQIDDNVIEKYCYADDGENCAIYGGLYQWAEAMALPEACNRNICTLPTESEFYQGICPDGWHLPRSQEWDVLANFLGGYTVAGSKMKANITGYPAWDNPPYNDGNSSGFSALPVGYRNAYDGYADLGLSMTMWEITQIQDPIRSSYHFVHVIPTYWDPASLIQDVYMKTRGYSVRCVKN